ncbi:MAG TPA: DUF1629 domain-containing protein [Acetobacteraceae bacterium]|nr:DUF1629 domain-containing protein [Acetobacteraceae bacterium]
MNTFPLWLVERDADISAAFGRMLLRDGKLGVQNDMEFNRAEHALRIEVDHWSGGEVYLPAGFPMLRLALPDKKFAPDFFGYGGYHFCSARFRDALAQPDGVAVQYMPIQLVSGSEAARAQDYRLLRILASESPLDMERSICKVEEVVNVVTGRRRPWLRSLNRIVVADGFVPKSEIFCIEEASSNVLVTDALAERLLRAGCTGMRFLDPAVNRSGMYILRIRTAGGGVREARFGF